MNAVYENRIDYRIVSYIYSNNQQYDFGQVFIKFLEKEGRTEIGL